MAYAGNALACQAVHGSVTGLHLMPCWLPSHHHMIGGTGMESLHTVHIVHLLMNTISRGLSWYRQICDR
jgi:hypothetical protein